MSSYVALLRGVNVGGNNLVPMASLREMATSLGLLEVRTWLQSGNLVFQASNSSAGEIERFLEIETEKRFGFFVTYVARTRIEWDRIVAANPFSELASEDPSHLIANPLKSPPDVSCLSQLEPYCLAGEEFELIGQTLYLAYPNGIGTSKVTNAVIERALKTKGTARNWNTVLKLAELASQ